MNSLINDNKVEMYKLNSALVGINDQMDEDSYSQRISYLKNFKEI